MAQRITRLTTHHNIAGSNPAGRLVFNKLRLNKNYNITFYTNGVSNMTGSVAQRITRLTTNEDIASSNPAISKV